MVAELSYNFREMKISKFKEELNAQIEENLQVKLTKLRLGKGKTYFLTHIDYPQLQKEKDRLDILLKAKNIEGHLNDLKILIKQVKSYFVRIFDQNKYSASYLLLGKAVSNLEAGILLSKNGFSEEMSELSRSGHESIDLGFLFLHDDNKALLERWFKGEIIENNNSSALQEINSYFLIQCAQAPPSLQIPDLGAVIWVHEHSFVPSMRQVVI